MTAQKDYRLDFLKGVSICLVLIWHLKPIQLVNYGSNTLYLIVNGLRVGLMHEVCLLAVPTFFTVSLYIFFKKSADNSVYVGKRIKKLMHIYFFWMLMQVIISYFVVGNFQRLSLNFLVMGGPRLPIVGDSVFYFLFDLTVLTLISYIFLHLNDNLKVIIIWIVAVLSLLIFEIATIWTHKLQLQYFAPYNFLIYMPLSYYMVRHEDFFVKHRYTWLVLYAIFATQDLILIRAGQDLPIYGRVSIVSGTMAFVSFAMKPHKYRRKAFVLLSTYSLGIFAVHKYAKLGFYNVIKEQLYINLFGVGIDLNSLIAFFVAGMSTILIVYIMQKSILKKFV